MFRDKKVVVVMPAYNSARTLRRTYDEVMAQEIVDLVIVVDDASHDETVAVARTLPRTRLYPCVLGSRILGGHARKGGMPMWRYAANRFLTLTENLLLGAKLSEYHTGYRGFSREILEKLNLANNSDDFVFDNQMLAQILWHGFTIAEVSCPTKYFPEASSINLRRSIRYGIGCLTTALKFRLAKMGLGGSKLFHNPNRSD